MSQQINLIDPALRPRRDWLQFKVVAPVALACLAVVVAASAFLRWERRALEVREGAVNAQLKTSQERLQALAQSVGQRVGDPRLAAESELLATEIRQRQEVLGELERGRGQGPRFSEDLRGLARQTMDGLWLTAFAAGGDSLEIRGRMLDSSLLPAYIRRLNAEPAFQGRRFDALDVSEGVRPKPAQGAEGEAKALERRLPPYSEFVLRAGAAPEKSAPGGRS